MHLASMNNALEATNPVIKDEEATRERLVLSRFAVVVFSIAKKWSKEQNPACVNSEKMRTRTFSYIIIVD